MQKSRLWALITALALVIGTVGLAACGSSDDTTGSSDTAASSPSGGSGTAALGLTKEGTLTVGSDIPYPPFEDGSNGDYTGFDIDVVNQIAEGLGVTAEFQDTSFDTIFADLASGKFDAVASAATITPERQQQVNFSDPYYSADQSLIIAPGSDVKTVDDLAGLNVAAQNGTTGLDFAKNETKAANVQGFPQGPDVINAVQSGQVDAGILDQPVAQDAVDKGAPIEVAAVIPTGELYGIAVPKDNAALLKAINAGLATMKSDGSLDKIYQQYFGIDAPKQVVDGTTKNPAG